MKRVPLKKALGGDSERPRKSREPLPLRDKRGKEREVPLTYTAKELGRARPLDEHPDVVMERFWLAVGRKQGVKAREIVGAIANEAGIEGQFIGSINIFEHYSTVDLPEGMPKPILKHLRKPESKALTWAWCASSTHSPRNLIYSRNLGDTLRLRSLL